MRIFAKHYHITRILAGSTCLLVALSSACVKKNAEESDEEESSAVTVGTGGSTTTDTTTPPLEVNSLEDLRLADSLAISLSQSNSGGSGLHLQTLGLKSREACQLRETSRRVIGELNYMRSVLCKLEVESSVMELGKKYTAEWGSGDTYGSFGLFADNSRSGELTVYVCSDGQLTQKYMITAGSGANLRGTMKAVRQWTDPNTQRVQNTQIGGSFDSGVTQPLRKRAGLLTRVTDDQGHDDLFGVYFSLRDDGLSLIKSAHTREHQGSGWASVATMKGSADGGMTMIGTTGGVYRSYFDAEGVQVSAEENDQFAAQGSLHVAADDLGELLPLETDPAVFADDDWDCSGGESWVFNEGGARSSEHAACDAIANTDLGYESCGDTSVYEWAGDMDASVQVTAIQTDPITSMASEVTRTEDLD